jgi:hypothetical protein
LNIVGMDIVEVAREWNGRFTPDLDLVPTGESDMRG